MEYIEWMNNLRHAKDIIAKLVPEILEAIQEKADREQDRDLDILLTDDLVWYSLQKQFEEVEDKLYQFNPEEEYGSVNTMCTEDMMGNER